MSNVITVTRGPQVTDESQVTIGHLGDPDPRGYSRLLPFPNAPCGFWEPWEPSVRWPDTFLDEPEVT